MNDNEFATVFFILLAFQYIGVILFAWYVNRPPRSKAGPN